MTTDDALAALRAKLTAPYHPPEPIYDRLYDEYIRNADYDGWVPGGIGRVIEQMEIDTNPDRAADLRFPTHRKEQS